jgi:hypothetical protein
MGSTREEPGFDNGTACASLAPQSRSIIRLSFKLSSHKSAIGAHGLRR